jgi:RNA polymerase sigma-70 factor (ECF subfamily)
MMGGIQNEPVESASGGRDAGDEADLVAALRRGDEAAFVTLVERYHTALLRLAMLYVGDRPTAEEVVQETWLGVLRGLGRFAARSSLKTWLFHILLNRAKTRAQREDRTIPFSAHWDRATAPDEPAVAPERFLPADHPRWPHHWASRPRDWGDTPEERFLSQETRACLDAAIAVLPPSQREVIVLRDIEGWTAAEACHLLAISETNQRVLLHRARSKVRQALEYHLEEGMGAA